MNGFLTNLKPTRLFFGRQIRRAKCANLWLTNNNEFVNLQPSQFCNLKKPLICSKEFKSIYLQDCWSSQILGKKLPYSVLNLFVCLIGPQILDPVMGRPLSRGSASSPRGWRVCNTPSSSWRYFKYPQRAPTASSILIPHKSCNLISPICAELGRIWIWSGGLMTTTPNPGPTQGGLVLILG